MIKYIFNNIGVRELVDINLLKMNVLGVYQSAEFYYRVLLRACTEGIVRALNRVFLSVIIKPDL